ncbi:MAG: bifunctional diaminohydroxyphosphoribosylaminopyrimidine deaminase/5-amino-6-(5-phosphoribosylamino)uracil reductase RibD [Bacteroidetes bacterium]|nr:bifunctional diaminohydroxyphosphoribosylaminopyrimidine deaminase/5-amino-6-(5-phosphoribosylamino)uracil reductase RibD [Bacteroidota bacterium]
MQRCIALAKKGAGYVAPNPLVGAVLMYQDRIIGEGWHKQYGQAHAEVNCIEDAINNGFAAQIAESTLYVTLEPCAHFGKTPPCADLIIRHRIPRVVIGCRDPFPAVNGKGIEKLQAAGMEVIVGVLEAECRELNKRFFCFHEKKRPYIILKWAQTADGFIAPLPAADKGIPAERWLISNEISNRLVHRWRSEEAAILVGTNTALWDDPALTNRLWPGPSPVRLVVDMDRRLPATLRIFNGDVKTIVFNAGKSAEEGNTTYYQLNKNEPLIPQLLQALYQLQLQSVLVEGGATLLRSFIEANAWDEARVLTAMDMRKGSGLAAPELTSARLAETTRLLTDTIEQFQPTIPH